MIISPRCDSKWDQQSDPLKRRNSLLKGKDSTGFWCGFRRGGSGISSSLKIQKINEWEASCADLLAFWEIRRFFPLPTHKPVWRSDLLTGILQSDDILTSNECRRSYFGVKNPRLCFHVHAIIDWPLPEFWHHLEAKAIFVPQRQCPTDERLCWSCWVSANGSIFIADFCKISAPKKPLLCRVGEGITGGLGKWC